MQEFKAAAKSSFVAMTSLAAAIKSAATNLTPAQLKEIRRQKAATPKGPRIPKRSRVFVGGVDPGACALVLSLCVDAVTLTPHTRLYLCAGEETRTTNDHAAPTGTRGAMRSVDDLIDANSHIEIDSCFFDGDDMPKSPSAPSTTTERGSTTQRDERAPRASCPTERSSRQQATSMQPQQQTPTVLSEHHSSWTPTSVRLQQQTNVLHEPMFGLSCGMPFSQSAASSPAMPPQSNSQTSPEVMVRTQQQASTPSPDSSEYMNLPPGRYHVDRPFRPSGWYCGPPPLAPPPPPHWYPPQWYGGTLPPPQWYGGIVVMMCEL